MVKSADIFDADNLAHEHARQLSRLVIRKHGPAATKAQVLEVLRDLMLQRIARFARTMAQLGEAAGEAAHQVDVLNRVLKDVVAQQAKGTGRHGKK